ncbi:hypothetical protein EGH22_16615 [Halomicroarcula sp. F28]|uniref:hypothetical protein n=1 Tax=Haloarcula salinisoli TaxID=2487746 RepID=UPI001C72A592|nr:hypothetical protein [Halomicroarcula salinisoli]MBX0287957.1 hypothetical protein [Halomicroarcula salinisoli]
MSEETDGESLHLRVSVGEITIEVDGPVDDAEAWFESLQEDYLSDIDTETVETAANGAGTAAETGAAEQSSSSESVSSSSGKSRSLTEFYKQADDPMKRDAALLVGWYLEYHDGQSDFTSSEVEDRGTDAKIGLGANVSRDLSKQVSDGNLEKVDERNGQDAYHLTLTGEEYVEEELFK